MISKDNVQLGLPKGRMKNGVFSLLEEAGIKIQSEERTYRPSISIPGMEVKVLKSQNIVEMLDVGSRDIGFAGADWVEELGVNLIELLDTGLDPVRIVAAAPESLLENGSLPKRSLLIASEYQRLTQNWIDKNRLQARVIRSFGATEVFPPEDADCIVDNTASGLTLTANQLSIIDELCTSSTRLYASPYALEDQSKRQRIEDFVLLLRSVLEARSRVMLEINVPSENLGKIAEVLPCMRQPTVSELHEEAGFAVKAAIPRRDLPSLIPRIKALGGSDIVVSDIRQIVP